ncbi:hypothetical protein AUJ14_01970 [Candidatus Micrarchaeota archaeon CG1_02_55_22]|nr:MAG: hypothetical protein AUJ14_01970 [Candidatus Micrarchaeota archaeon CG1_02_55_22]
MRLKFVDSLKRLVAKKKLQPAVDKSSFVKAFEKELSAASGSRDVGKAVARLESAVRAFFRDYYSLGYAFSFEELESELSSKHVPVRSREPFLAGVRVLNDLSYGSDGASKKAVTDAVDAFRKGLAGLG